MGDRLKDKVAVITGSGEGIGRAIAIVMAREGAKVVVNNRAPRPPLDSGLVAKEINAAGGTAVHVFADISTLEGAEKVIKAAIDNFGTLDILVNNAGITRDLPLHRMTEKDFDDVMKICLYGAFNCAKVAASYMVASARKEKEEGKPVAARKIISFTSGAGIRGNPGQTNYSSAKAGIIGLTKALTKELARYNILVNAISPSALTKMTLDMPEEWMKAYVARIPLGRVGDPEKDIAPVALFLASDDANYITGQVLIVSGGLDM